MAQSRPKQARTQHVGQKHVWEGSYPKGTHWHFKGAKQPVFALLDDAAHHHPNRTCLRFLGSTLTYAEVLNQANHLAGGLQRLGVKKGDKVGLCLPNCPYFVISYFAILKVGAVVVNLNPLLTAEELAHQVRDSQSSVIITTNLKRIFSKVEPLVGQGHLRHAVVVNFAAALPPVKRWLFRVFKAHHISWFYGNEHVHRFEDIAAHSHFWPVSINPEADLALLQYTGGTTGTPKAAMLTHANLSSNTRQIQAWLGPTNPSGEHFLIVLPLFHVFAMSACMNLALATASTLTLLPLFNLKQLIKIIEKDKPTLFPGVPTLFAAIAGAPGVEKLNLKSIRWCISGGAPLPLEVKQKFEKLTGCRMVEGYGLTEASPVVICNPRHNGGVPGAIGLPLPGTEVQIRSLHNMRKAIAPGRRGEIFIKGPQVMAGYWNRPDETAKTLVDGWLRTGDVGYMDTNGYIYLTDRLKDIIITNGYNVYPRVIEEVVYRHPAVAEVTAIAIPSRHKGEVAKIYVTLKEGAKATEAELLAFAREHLNPLERPVAAEIRTSLPKTFTGKLSKKELVAEEKRKRELH